MPAAAVVPLPASIEADRAARFRVTTATTIVGDPDAAHALAALVEARTGWVLARRVEPEAGRAIILSLAASHTKHAPESYSIRVDEDAVVLTGADAAGLFYAAQTLGQLLERDGEGWSVPAVRIDDAPRFAYRGVMLDVARHFQPVETVMAYIDRAAGLKFNVLHLHLTDDQGWRLELDSRPLLTARASATSVSGDPGGFYTKAQYRAIVKHATARHMTVVPEIDVPGHTHAVGAAHPELVEAPVLTDEMRDTIRTHGGGDPEPGVPYRGIAVGFSSLRIRDEATYDFLADVFGELAGMTPGPYLHFGGDEALGTAPEDFAAFVARASEIIADLGKTPIAWHEAGAARGLAPATIGQYWGFVSPTDGMDDKARAFVAAGGRIILSPADAVYLDMKPTAEATLGLTWANGPTGVERAYRWEPLAVVDGIVETDILGVEAPLWTETVRDLADIDLLAFPRIAAAAEAAWSPAAASAPQRTWESFRERVGALGPLWESLGIGFDRSAEIPWRRDA